MHSFLCWFLGHQLKHVYSSFNYATRLEAQLRRDLQNEYWYLVGSNYVEVLEHVLDFHWDGVRRVAVRDKKHPYPMPSVLYYKCQRCGKVEGVELCQIK